MALNVRIPAPPASEQVCKTVAGIYQIIAIHLANRLSEIVSVLSDAATAAEFWSLQGTDGVANLVAFGKARDLLQEIAPDLVSPELAAAGSTLVANQDGTVTVPAE
mgnify:FL=1